LPLSLVVTEEERVGLKPASFVGLRMVHKATYLRNFQARFEML
jgi:hypothetical protein